MFRVADLIGALFVLFENVNGIRSKHWARLLQQFQVRHFLVRWVTLNATSVGCPQKRRRFSCLLRGDDTCTNQ